MNEGAGCSSVVRAFAHGAMGRRIDPSWWAHWAISQSSQSPTTGVPNAVVCVILSLGKSSLCGSNGFLLSLSEWSVTIFCGGNLTSNL